MSFCVSVCVCVCGEWEALFLDTAFFRFYRRKSFWIKVYNYSPLRNWTNETNLCCFRNYFLFIVLPFLSYFWSWTYISWLFGNNLILESKAVDGESHWTSESSEDGKKFKKIKASFSSLCPSEWVKWDLWSSGDGTFAVRSAPGMKWALMSDGGSVQMTWWRRSGLQTERESQWKASTAVTVSVFILYFLIFEVFFHSLFVPSELRCCSLLYSGTLVNQSAFGRCLHHLLTAMRG